MENQIFFDGDFKTSKTGKCEFHCWPSCHPAQIGPRDVFGCTHRAWPMNRYGDFVPIVDCGGDILICEFKTNKGGKKWAGHWKSGLTRRLNFARQKLINIEKEFTEFHKLIANKH